MRSRGLLCKRRVSWLHQALRLQVPKSGTLLEEAGVLVCHKAEVPRMHACDHRSPALRG